MATTAAARPYIPAKHESSRDIILEGPRDDLWLEPVKFDSRLVAKRAEEVARETENLNAEDAIDQDISPSLIFLISEQNHSFTILHGDTLQRIPGMPVSTAPITTRMIEPESLLGCYWSMNSIPYMGFLPVNPYRACFGDSLFSPVFLRKWELPLQQTLNKHWTLRRELARQWQHLEDILVALREILVGSIRVRGSQEHLHAPRPSYYRFSAAHADCLLVTKRLVRTRYAFLLLGAEISFLYALQSQDAHFASCFPERLQRHFGHPALVERILDSWLFWQGTGFFPQRGSYLPDEVAAQRTCPRQGMFVNVKLCTLAHALRAYENFHVPVWFWWGNRILTHTPQSAIIARRYGFHRAMVGEYLARVGATRRDLETGRMFEPLVYKASYEERPCSKPLQIITPDSVFAPAPHEQWFEFFQRRERAILAWPVKNDQRKLTAARQLGAQINGLEEGSSVFEWLPLRDVDALVRRRVPTHERLRVWAEYKPNQRYYCAAYDEWDLSAAISGDTPSCYTTPWQEDGIEASNHATVHADLSGLAPEVRTASHSPPQAVCSEGKLVPVASLCEQRLQFAPPQGSELDDGLEDGEVCDEGEGTVIDWATIYRSLYPVTDGQLESRRVESPAFATVLHSFYGVYVPAHFVRNLRLRAVSDDKANEALRTLLRALSCSSPNVEEQVVYDASAYHQLITYFEHLEWYAAAQRLRSLPPHGPAMAWSDLVASHPAYVLSNLREQLVIQRIQWRIRREINYQFYWPNTLIRVMLYRATDVLWLLRRIKEISVGAALRQLVTLGIRFTFATIALTPLPPPLPASESIPWRRLPFRATIVDYQEYIARRARLFSSSTVLRAALLSGGIIWRIAMDHTSDPGSVLTATAEEIQRIGSRAVLPNGDVLAEISLTDEQKQVIIGAYRVSATLPAPKDCGTVSWFPSPASFARSGINVGFWSVDAESWYQKRVQNYLDGVKQPVPKRSWMTTMNLHQPAYKVARGYEDRARTLLDAALT